MQLIITEKPSVAQAICNALGIKDKEKHKGYIEGEDRIVSWCYGHLVELAEPAAYGKQYRKWSYDALPIIPGYWKYDIKQNTKEQFEILKKLMERKDVTGLICATDAGREGELIFRLVYEKAGCRKPFKRLWISSMEEKAIREGFENLKSGKYYDDLYKSARCRQEADWLVGINGTRLFSVLYGKTLKVGRVQTPTLAMLVERQEEIERFKKEPFYVVHLSGSGIDAVSEHIKDKTEAESLVRACCGKPARVISVTKETKTIPSPKLYDLTSLQRDANRLFDFTAKQTLDYTQSLYEKKLVTYPRTDSRFLTDDMGKTVEEILGIAGDIFRFIGEDIVKSSFTQILNSKKVTDHHAIIPTVEIGKADLDILPDGETKILSLTVKRLAEAVSGNYCYTSVKAVLKCGDHEFTATGRTVEDKGWKNIDESYRAFFKTEQEEKEEGREEEGEVKEGEREEKVLPELYEGQEITDKNVETKENFTQPPKPYTEESLLSAMEHAGESETVEEAERKGLGTPATRADIIEKLVKDGYVKRSKKQLVPTGEGLRLITIMPEMVRSAKLTSEWENNLSRVAKGDLLEEEFMKSVTDMVRNLVSTYHEVSEEKTDRAV